MAASVTHTKVSAIADGGDTDLVRPSDWNANHTISIAAADIGAAPNTGVDYLVGTATGSLTGEIAVGTTPGGELGGTWASPTVDATHAGSTHVALTSDTPAAVGTAGANGSGTASAKSDHVHAHEGAHINHDTTWAAQGDLIVATGNDAAAVLGKGATGTFLQAGASTLGYADVFIPVTFAKTGVLTTGTGTLRWYNDSGRTLTIASVRASVNTAPTGANGVTVDVNVDATTIYTTGPGTERPVIAASGFTDEGGTPDVTTIADQSYLTVDIDTVGGTIAGSDLTVTVWLKG